LKSFCKGSEYRPYENAKYKLAKGNISFAPIGNAQINTQPESFGQEALEYNQPAQNNIQGFSVSQDMPDPKRYAQGFASLGNAKFESTNTMTSQAHSCC